MAVKRKGTVKGRTNLRSLVGTYRPETVNLEERTVEMVFTTGEAGVRYDWWNDVSFLEELDVSEQALRTERLDKGLPVMNNHRTYDGIEGQYGVTEGWRIESGKLVGTVRFARDEKSDVAFQKVADGIIRSTSLGYKVHEYTHIPSSEENKLDTLRATDWEPTELSLVPIPFEKGIENGVRAERNDETDHTVTIRTEDEEMFLQFGRFARHVKQEGADGELGSPVPAATAAPTEIRGEGDAPTPVIQQQSAPVQESRTLGGGVNSIDAFRNSAKAAGFDSDHAIDAYQRGISINDYNAELLAAMAQRSQSQTIKQFADGERQDHKDGVRKGVQEYLEYLTNNRSELTPDAAKFKGARLLDLGMIVADSKGLQRFGTNPMELAKRAMHTTSDFPLLLENVMNKSLMRGFEETPRTFIGLGNSTTVNDFRAKHTYKMGDAPSLRPLNEHGEYERGTFSEGKESYAIDTFARQIAFTRKLLINDDLSALDRFPSLFGAAGSRLESDVVWGLLLNYNFMTNKAANYTMSDGKAFYHADHKNLLTGTTSALSKAGLSKLRKLGRDQKTLDGHFMNVMWNTLVVPQSLETEAEELLSVVYSPNRKEDINVWTGKLDYRVEPRLEVLSSTAYYAFTRMYDAFEYANLAGEAAMMTEVVEQTNADGLVINVRKDFGAGFVEERASVKMAGA